MRSFAILLIALLLATTSEDNATWSGTLDAGGMKLRLVFHLTASSDGWEGTFDSVDQGAYGIPLDEVSLTGQQVRFSISSIQATYFGMIDSTATRIDGTWSQGGFSLPLDLTRDDVSPAPAPDRPQTPVPPFPYQSEEVSFDGGAPGVKIGGTLLIPASEGPWPAVVLLSGSGPQDRDESIFEHKPFLVIADHLVRTGVAVLRTDDRGVAESTGDFGAATLEDFAADASSAVGYLRSRDDIMSACIGLLGHSEGSIVATLVAEEPGRGIAFVVMLAGVGIPIPGLLEDQARSLMAAQGAAPDLIEANAEIQRAMFEVVRTEKDDARAAEEIRARTRPILAKLSANDRAMLERALEPSIEAVTSPGFRYLQNYDPATHLGRIKAPVLILAGERDLQVSPAKNLEAIAGAIRLGGNESVQTMLFPDLNHLFQTSKTGGIREYGLISETIAPVVLTKISDWIISDTCALQNSE